MGALSVPLQLPSLSSTSSTSGARRTHISTPLHSSCTVRFHGTHGPASSPRAARVRTRVMPVRVDASLSEIAPTAAAAYGALLLGGGYLAYARSSSVGSLVGGISGGFLMGAAFLLSLNPGSKDLGEAIGFGTALLFVAVFGIRLAATRKVFPGAPLLLLSIAASAVFVGAYLQDRV